MNRECDKAELIALTVLRLRALSDPVRVRIMMHLRRGESNVTTIVNTLQVAQTSISKHLAVLRQAGLVSLRKDGTQAFYSCRDESVYQILQLACDGMKRHQSEMAVAMSGADFFQI